MHTLSRGLAVLALVGLSAAAQAQIGYSVQSNGNDHLYQINLATGVATDLGLVGLDDAEGLAFVGSTLYGIGGTDNGWWDLTTAPGTLIGNTGTRNGNDAGLEYNSVNGVMYNIQGVSSSSSSLYSINVGTGAATLIGNGAAFSDGFAINSSGQAFSSDAIFADGLHSVDLNTGATTFIGGFGLGNVSVQSGMSFDNANTLWMLLSSGQIYNVNTGTGAATFVANVTLNGNNIGSFEGLAIQGGMAAVPEPGSVALLIGAGIGGMVFRRRRK